MIDRLKEAENAAYDQREEDLLATVTNFAHEARAPIAAMRRKLHGIRESDDASPSVWSACEPLLRQLSALNRLLDDIEGTDPKKLQVWLEPVGVVPILYESIELLRPMFEAKSQYVLSAIEPTTVRIMGDSMRLAQIFSNLLGNASKYSPCHSRIDVSFQISDGMAAVSVRDQGIGFEATDSVHIFEPHLGNGKAESLDDPSWGLPLVQQLVKLHGGTLEASSSGIGRGSEFIVRLPLATEALLS